MLFAFDRHDHYEVKSNWNWNEGDHYLATAKSALTSFSPSPSHLLVRLLELMLIRLLLASADRARASSVFPLPENLLSPRVESNSI